MFTILETIISAKFSAQLKYFPSNLEFQFSGHSNASSHRLWAAFKSHVLSNHLIRLKTVFIPKQMRNFKTEKGLPSYYTCLFGFFKKMGQPRPHFVYFRFFKHKFNRKNMIQQESNSDRRSEGEHVDHWTTTTVLFFKTQNILQSNRYLFLKSPNI